MTAAPTTASSRIFGLDGVRAFAVVAVIAAHAHVTWLHGGGVGVDVFFVLSGFLITGLLLAERERFGRIDLLRFWGRRLLRLMPALLVMIIPVTAFVILFGSRLGPTWDATLTATPSVLFYYSNWAVVLGGDLGGYGPLWSLSVEEQFYLVWPLVVIMVMASRNHLRNLAIVATAVVIAVNINRVVGFDGSELDRAVGTDYRVDILLMGALVSIALKAGFTAILKSVSSIAVLPAIVYLLLIAVIVPDYNAKGAEGTFRLYYTVGLPFVGVASCIVVAFLVTHQTSILVRILNVRPLAWIGRISYGVYLWHFVVTQVLIGLFHPEPNMLFVAALLGTLVVAAASWYVIERPLSRRFHEQLKPTSPSLASA